MTPWVIRIIVANVAVFFLQATFPPLTDLFAFVPAYAFIRPWTIVTYMFLHGGIFHIFFNMLIFYFLGPRLEARLGGRNFLWLYFLSGITGGLLSIPFTPFVSIVGASGAVFGIMLGAARYWPDDRIFIIPIPFPIPLRVWVIGMTVMSLWAGFSGAGGNVAHFAHLGGFLGGFLFLKWVERHSPAAQFRAKAQGSQAGRIRDAMSFERWKRIRRDDLHEINRGELDRILDKISAHGVESLTPDERGFLERFSVH